jgi:hypothetical protein
MEPSGQRRLGMPICGPHSPGAQSSGVAAGGALPGPGSDTAAEPAAGAVVEPAPGDEGCRPHAATMQRIQANRASCGMPPA